MNKVPCVNTIELNKYLDDLDAADARYDEIMRIAQEEIDPVIFFQDESICEAIAERLQDADNKDDILFVKACIVYGYNSDSLDELIVAGVEDGHCNIAEMLHDHENLPEAAQAIVEEYVQAEALRLAEVELERIERNGPDCE